MTAPALPRQPLLIVSDRSDADAKVRCLELGASDFLARPFAAAELVARVRIQLHRSQEPGTGRSHRAVTARGDRRRPGAVSCAR